MAEGARRTIDYDGGAGAGAAADDVLPTAALLGFLLRSSKARAAGSQGRLGAQAIDEIAAGEERAALLAQGAAHAGRRKEAIAARCGRGSTGGGASSTW